MKQTQCIWKGCKETIKVDDEMENSSVGQRMGLVVVGWCNFHSKVYNKQQELFAKLDKKKHHSDIANHLYKTNRKKYNKIQSQAIKAIRNES